MRGGSRRSAPGSSSRLGTVRPGRGSKRSWADGMSGCIWHGSRSRRLPSRRLRRPLSRAGATAAEDMAGAAGTGWTPRRSWRSARQPWSSSAASSPSSSSTRVATHQGTGAAEQRLTTSDDSHGRRRTPGARQTRRRPGRGRARPTGSSAAACDPGRRRGSRHGPADGDDTRRAARRRSGGGRVPRRRRRGWAGRPAARIGAASGGATA